jgi:Family of unknown function (DUF6416)
MDMSYVMMAIPAELVPAVTAFIEGRGETAVDSGKPLPSNAGFVHGWDADTARRAYRESADKMRNLLEFLARNPEREVSSEEIAEAIGARFGWNTVAGMLGAFGRRCTNRYGRLKPMWEFRNDDSGRILITMPLSAAEVIREAEVSNESSDI